MCSLALIKNQIIIIPKIIYHNFDNMIVVFAILDTACLVFYFHFNSLAKNSATRDPEIHNMICVISFKLFNVHIIIIVRNKICASFQTNVNTMEKQS